MRLPPYGNVLTVRPEILDARGLLDMVDLGVLHDERPRRGLAARVPGLDTVRDPAAFFEITYPTAEIVGTLKTLGQRAADPSSVPGTILLNGRYGLGKSHVMLAAHHALLAPDVVRAWATRWGVDLPEFPRDPIVITRSFIQEATKPLWEMLLDALSAGGKPKVKDFVDGRSIEALLGDRPVVLIMDELERWYDAQDPLAQSRNRNFLQALTEVSMRDGRVTVLGSVLGERAEPAETIRRVNPLELSFTSSEDRQRIVLFRLFSDRDTLPARAAAAAAADAYVAAWQRAEIRGAEGLRSRVLASWPFTPEFLDILTKKVPERGGFQNTRGTLRFLALVVRHTHQRRPMVSSQDLPIRDDVVAQALSHLDTAGGEVVRRALGDNYEAVPADHPHKHELFSTLVLYSVADPTHPGATLDEILLATLDPDENALGLRDAVVQLEKLAFNLHRRDDRLVFLAAENPHARVRALAASPRVTREAQRAHILDALATVWGGRERTVIFVPGEREELAQALKSMRAQRPRFLLSTTSLSPKERLGLQNLEEDRNLVLLVEPRRHKSTTEVSYQLLSDDTLIEHARRIEACRLLLEGRPAQDTATVYRDIRDDDTRRLRKAVTDRYGLAIVWNRAGAGTAEVDDTWYDVVQIDDPTAEAFLRVLRQDHTGLPEVTRVVRGLWPQFRHRPVRDLAVHFDRTPGVPIPVEAGWVAQAVRRLAYENELSLVDAQGTPVPRARVTSLSDDDTITCLLGDPRSGGTTTGDGDKGKPTPPTHPMVSAQYDAARKAVALKWRYPAVPPIGGSYRTLVQRYQNARNWSPGQSYPLSADGTHGANRYFGDDDHALDADGLIPGEWYYYYAFLVYQDPQGTETYTLSNRCDVGVPKETVSTPDVLDTGVQPSPQKMVIEAERLVMSGKYMSADARVRKIEVRVDAVTDERLRTVLGDRLHAKAGDALEASGSLVYTLRGAYDRAAVLAWLRLVPTLVGATYAARLHLTSDTNSGD